MRQIVVAAGAALLATLAVAGPGAAQVGFASNVVVSWEVKNRFRLFRDERDFRRHAEAAQGRTVLEAEQALAAATDGGGWARPNPYELLDYWSLLDGKTGSNQLTGNRWNVVYMDIQPNEGFDKRYLVFRQLEISFSRRPGRLVATLHERGDFFRVSTDFGAQDE